MMQSPGVEGQDQLSIRVANCEWIVKVFVVGIPLDHGEITKNGHATFSLLQTSRNAPLGLCFNKRKEGSSVR